MSTINKNNKIILVYSPQGGTGKSLMAVNTAMFLASQGTKTLLVDMAVYGSITSGLRIPQKGGSGISALVTLMDLDQQIAGTDKFYEVLKKSIVSNIGINNLDVLTSANPIKMEGINENYTRAIVDGIKKLNYDVIIVDTSSELSVKNIILLEEAMFTVIPVVQDINCGWKVVLFREIMERYMINSNKFGIIVNKCSKYSGFNNLEFENEIGYKIISEIPLFTKKFQTYLNQGLNIYSIKNRAAKKSFVNSAKMIMKYINS